MKKPKWNKQKRSFFIYIDQGSAMFQTMFKKYVPKPLKLKTIQKHYFWICRTVLDFFIKIRGKALNFKKIHLNWKSIKSSAFVKDRTEVVLAIVSYTKPWHWVINPGIILGKTRKSVPRGFFLPAWNTVKKKFFSCSFILHQDVDQSTCVLTCVEEEF